MESARSYLFVAWVASSCRRTIEKATQLMAGTSAIIAIAPTGVTEVSGEVKRGFSTEKVVATMLAILTEVFLEYR